MADAEGFRSTGESAVRFVRASERTGSPTALRWSRPAAVAACLPLLACGTDVQWLLARDSLLVARADRAAAVAEAVEPELATEMYDAEDAKRAACETIYAPIAAYMTTSPSFGEELAADVGAFLAYIFPIPAIERCADAQARYQETVEALERRVGAGGD